MPEVLFTLSRACLLWDPLTGVIAKVVRSLTKFDKIDKFFDSNDRVPSGNSDLLSQFLSQAILVFVLKFFNTGL